MTPQLRLASYAGALVVVFLAALGLGRAVGPIDVGDPPAHEVEHPAGHSDEMGAER